MVLEEARRRGFLGPGPVGGHVAHARPLLTVLPTTGLAVDLGSGGGIPALVLALALPGLSWNLVEARQGRAQWLTDAIRRLRLDQRVAVRQERAELTGRGELRGCATVVTARSFARPAVTAECGAPLLAPGGVMWVAEPPRSTSARWPASGLAQLGFGPERGGVPGWVGVVLSEPCPQRYPRRIGIPAKRPLF